MPAPKKKPAAKKPAKKRTGGAKQVKKPAGKPPMPKGGKPGQYQWSSAQGRWVNLGGK